MVGIKPFPDYVLFYGSKPDLEKIKDEFGVPRENIILDAFSPSRAERRKTLEVEAEKIYRERIKDYEQQVEEAYDNYYKEKAKYDSKLQAIEKKLKDCNTNLVKSFVRKVLRHSNYPPSITKDFSVQFEPSSRIIVIDYWLPIPDDLPKTVQYKYVAARKIIEPVKMKKKELNNFYEEVIYKVALRTVYEIFDSGCPCVINSVVFNGWVKSIDPATGREYTACILSFMAPRDVFMEFNLGRVDPKETIRRLKGIIAGPLAQLAPVKPVMSIKREDSRFIESREVLEKLEPSKNLAEMDWEDFEHLVRELFEKMFAKSGGEVRVTQASRDRGIDAVAFDPDPIRGGKFVIQAKRYNIVVPVSAVRDLYGTMINEGAVKGILVTTSHYGHDSREFAKDKPITLIDGPGLVYLFKQYGYDVRIELKKKAA